MTEILEYMKAVLEGEDGLPTFSQWFRENDAAIEQMCSRGSYLRLKNNPIPEFHKILTEKGIAFNALPNASLPHEPSDFGWIKYDWLVDRLIPYKQSPTKLALANNIYVDELLHMIDIKRTGDELWRFSSPPETWQRKCGSAGIALVRDRQIVHAIITMRN